MDRPIKFLSKTLTVRDSFGDLEGRCDDNINADPAEEVS
jgi:hypothetical protein